jgi:predicted nucleic-acid-binding protein
MIGLDTNILARYYIEDEADGEAHRQRLAARRLIESGQLLTVCKTVILELEWVMRGYYRFSPPETVAVFRHLLELRNVTIEDRSTVEYAVSNCEAGLDFADALHHASYRNCSSVASFDKRGFAGRAKQLGLAPAVTVPSPPPR